MNTYLFASVENTWLLAGWTMLHFLWLGTLVALTALPARWLLRRASANVRYIAALTFVATLAALPIAIAAWLAANAPPLKGGAGGGISNTVTTPAVDPLSKSLPTPSSSETIELHAPVGERIAPAIRGAAPGVFSAAVEPSPSPSLSGRGISMVELIETCIPYLPWFWLIGTPITFALTATGLLGTRRLRCASRPITDGPIIEALEKLVASLRLTRRVAVAVCDRIAAPVLIGILRPIILLPPAALTGYSPDEIEMVLLHELAHVRRWDNLVNFIQRLVESLLFFHPAVWLISSWARREREACCDALVVSRTDHPHAYAELLVALAAQMPRSVLFHPAASSAMAAGPLRSRIRRILKLDDDPMLVSGKSFALVLAGLLVVAMLAAVYLPTTVSAAPEVAKLEAQTKNNLKNQMLALLNFEAAHRSFPANAIYSPEGNPLLSWRVAILPFIDPKLYEEFHRDEPWDSEHNRKLIARMPDIFKNPKLDQPGKTNYLAVVGNECFMTGTPKKLGIKHITDGTSLTIALVEADPSQAVEWTRPVDWKFDRDRPTHDLGKVWDKFWYHTRVDGSIHRVDNSESADRIGIHFTRTGGETKSLQESTSKAPVEGAIAVEAAAGPEAGPSAGDSLAGIRSRNRDELEKSVRNLQSEIKRKYDDYLDIANSASKQLGNEFDPETNQLLLDISEIHARVQSLTTSYYQLHVDFLAAQGEWTNPSTFGPSREARGKPNTPLQQLTQRFNTQTASIQKQIEVLTQDLEQKKLQLQKRVEKSINLDTYGEDLKKLQRQVNDSLFQLRDLDVGAQAGEQARQPGRYDWFTGAEGVGAAGTEGDPSSAPEVKPLSFALKRGESGETEIYLNNKLTTVDAIRTMLREGDKSIAKPPVSLTADQGISYGKAVEIIDLLEALGVKKLALDTRNIKATDAQESKFDDSKARGKVTTPSNVAGKTAKTAGESASLATSKFPSLEQQKLADLAWKRLQLELEPLDEKDLKRIKALGYDGGLKVVGGHGQMLEQDKQILWDDILVGIHAWPITNFANLAEVLEREDLAELNPLKYYIVRHFDRENPPRDAVLSGRIGLTLLEDSSRNRYRIWRSNSSSRSNPPPSNTLTRGNAAGTTYHDIPDTREDESKNGVGLSTQFAEPQKKSGSESASVKRELKKSDGSRDDWQEALEISKRELEKFNLTDKNQNNNVLKITGITAVPATAANPKPVTATSQVPNTIAVPNVERVLVGGLGAAPSGPTTAPAPVTPKKAIFGDEGSRASAPAESVFVSYDIPPELTSDAQQYFRKTSVRSMNDGRGRRYIVQASRDWHEHFAALLKATPTWRDPAAAKERASAAVVMKKVDGENILEFRCIGLSFKPMADTRKIVGTSAPTPQPGVAVVEVAPGSPAAWGDIRPGDVLTDIGSFHAGSMPSVHSLIKALGEGLQSQTQVQFRFVRETANRMVIVADFALGPEDLGATPANPQNSKPSANTTVGSAPVSRSHFNYDGKSFYSWRTAWQTELSSDKRIEAIKALAAFGANGYGPEAAEAILDVAGQYDFSAADSGNDVILKKTIGDYLVPDNRTQSLAKYWVPILIARLEKDPSKWQGLAIHLLYHLRADDKATLANLYSLAKVGPAEVRMAALDVLVNSSRSRNNGPKIDDRVREFLGDSLQSKDPSIAGNALRHLLYYPWNPNGNANSTPELIFQKELVPVLFHPDERVCQQARGVLRYISKEDASAVIKQLVDIIQDKSAWRFSKSRQQDHVHALRGIAAIGPNAESALPELEKLLATKNPGERIAAATAIKKIVGKDKYQKPVADVIGEELGITVVQTGNGVWGALPRDNNVDVSVFNKFTEDVIKEQDLLFPPDDNKPPK